MLELLLQDKSQLQRRQRIAYLQMHKLSRHAHTNLHT